VSESDRCARCGRARRPNDDPWADDAVEGPICPDCFSSDERILFAELRERRFDEIYDFLREQDVEEDDFLREESAFLQEEDEAEE
jgi:hypothetical protein